MKRIILFIWCQRSKGSARSGAKGTGAARNNTARKACVAVSRTCGTGKLFEPAKIAGLEG